MNAGTWEFLVWLWIVGGVLAAPWLGFSNNLSQTERVAAIVLWPIALCGCVIVGLVQLTARFARAITS